MKVVSPRTLEEALAALRDAPAMAHPLAGGTDLMVEMDVGRTRPAHVVDLWRVDELRRVEVEADGLRLGALVTCTQLLESPLVRERADVLAAAAREFGAVQIRNRATLGGNLGTASPAADLVPALFALGARVRLASAGGARELPATELVTGYRATQRRPDELIESVLIPARPAGERRAFRKVGTRAAQSISKVVVAVAIVPEDVTGAGAKADGGPRLSAATAAAGSVDARTLCLPTIARELVGPALTPALVDAAARAAADDDVSPRDDVRSTATYRRETLYRVLRRLLLETALPS